MFFRGLLIVLIIKNQEYSMKSMSNSLDPYGSRNFVGPDLGPNYLHQQTTLVVRVNSGSVPHNLIPYNV